MHECMNERGFRTLTKCWKLDLGRRARGLGDLRVRKRFGSREKSFYRERSEKMRSEIAPQP